MGSRRAMDIDHLTVYNGLLVCVVNRPVDATINKIELSGLKGDTSLFVYESQVFSSTNGKIVVDGLNVTEVRGDLLISGKRSAVLRIDFC